MSGLGIERPPPRLSSLPRENLIEADDSRLGRKRNHELHLTYCYCKGMFCVMRRCHSVRPRGGFHGVSCQEVEHRGRLFARRQDHVDGCSPTGAGGNLTGLDPDRLNRRDSSLAMLMYSIRSD